MHNITRWPTPVSERARLLAEPALEKAPTCQNFRGSRFLEDLPEAPWPTGLLRPSEEEALALKQRRRCPLSSLLKSIKSFLQRLRKRFSRHKSLEDWGA